MNTAIKAIAPLTTDQLTNIGISAVIAKAVALSRDPELDKWRDLYEPAKRVIAEMNLTADEYERAIKMLTEALKI